MINRLFIILIRAYQTGISPFLPPSCRFYPTCSEYALEALQKYSFLKACFSILSRLGKCHPYHQGGHDPVQ